MVLRLACRIPLHVYGEALCIHNAATGREATMPHVVSKGEGVPKHIVFIGAGPAGLEAARVVSTRGHTATVLEASDKSGRAGFINGWD